ncbi:MAG: VTT domain-containing protein [SAR202 cluster bacterium]|nr:VTT domain-containing protein [SAR202 cluster bacterium]
MELLHDLAQWILSFADSPWALVILAISSFTESIFNPIPPDALLIAISLLKTQHSIWFATLVILTSVSGALVGHFIGKKFGRPILQMTFKGNRLISDNMITKADQLFDRYGVWAVLIAAFSPIPYKLIAIGAGVLNFDRKVFFIASLIGRTCRFMLIGIFIFFFGEQINQFINDYLGLITWIATGCLLTLIVCLIAYRVFIFKRTRK